MRINAMSRSVLQQSLSALNRQLSEEMAELTGADSEPVKASAEALKRTWKGLLGAAGPSPPGAPPGRRTGNLQRSTKSAVVEGVRRVGSGDPAARWAEFGTSPIAGAGGEAPRPHGRVAVELAEREMTDVMVSELQRRGGATV